MANKNISKVSLSKKYLRDGRAPVPGKESISKVMSANKAKNTRPEIILRKALWKQGLKGYRLHPKNIPGKPDVTFSKKKIAVFVNGCFWHRCPYCKLNLPNSKREFWSKKFETNIKRDKKKIRELRKIGWRTFTIWECEINNNILYIVNKLKKVYHNNFLL